jgi:hypothetical protein
MRSTRPIPAHAVPCGEVTSSISWFNRFNLWSTCYFLLNAFILVITVNNILFHNSKNGGSSTTAFSTVYMVLTGYGTGACACTRLPV